VRDVAVALDADPRVLAYTVEAENFESIHNHSAFARVTGRSPHADRKRARRSAPPAAAACGGKRRVSAAPA
jgi:hypothetical protein